jgi:hypothetical protein
VELWHSIVHPVDAITDATHSERSKSSAENRTGRPNVVLTFLARVLGARVLAYLRECRHARERQLLANKGINVRFDIYDGAMAAAGNDSNYRPSENVHKGFVGGGAGSAGNMCNAQPATFWPIGTPPNRPAPCRDRSVRASKGAL